MTTIAQEIRARINKLDCIKVKFQEIVYARRKFFVNYSLDKELISRICKELQKVNINSQAIQVLNWQMN
jgi:hypothetical protein